MEVGIRGIFAHKYQGTILPVQARVYRVWTPTCFGIEYRHPIRKGVLYRRILRSPDQRARFYQEGARMYRLLLLDMDGTLVEAFTTTILPTVQHKLARLRAQEEVVIGVCTNQAGPAWRYATGQGKYPTASKVASNILAIAETLHLQQAYWFIAVGDERLLQFAGEKADGVDALRQAFVDLQQAVRLPNVQVSDQLFWRKPQPGMLLAACDATGVMVDDTLYIGDRPDDAQAAANCGMAFCWAQTYFQGEAQYE